MSTFGGLNTAYTGLVAARQGLDVVGQNIANAGTEGYTRQRVTTSSVDAVTRVGLFSSGVGAGQGVSVTGIARLGSASLDAQVRASAAAAGFSAVRANSFSAVEAATNEPGTSGLSATLSKFWAGWQDVSNSVGDAAPAGVVLSQANAVAGQIASNYQAVATEWSSQRSSVTSMVSEVNAAATQVAGLNSQIRMTVAAGGSANELLDKRSALTTTIAALTGGVVSEQTDGTVSIFVGGNALVSGDQAQSLTAVGATSMTGTGANTGTAGTVQVVWTRDLGKTPPTAVSVDGGELAGALSLLGPATIDANGQGTGSTLADVAATYNAFATSLATSVNAVFNPTSTPGGNFFTVSTTGAAALGLSVLPKTATDLSAALTAAGAAVTAAAAATGSTTVTSAGTIADAVSQLGAGKATAIDPATNLPFTSPSADWSNVVTRLAVTTKSELQGASLADITSTAAVKAQLSNASVDLDEENVSLLMFQHAYQGAARVMTAVDEMLDVLINKTGLVGR
ncbi:MULTISPECIES: flagellar hook-associated protein FlgK [Cryobacterium]|uniref:Flagellar hook-associated protein 1 n=2 Tax=Cryobacterium TaxID=69578 RepID=A0ABY2IP29_9MICO|nr:MULTISPECIES: flagellar hook-associated protein FlgK [Cryobacterium]TFB95274.1 flagellar hook-associated protein FlgK [Cryobacterium sp. MDB2-A-1]TFC11309.1 flagellar hook-associated protein FlgK [Cryobacterium sp. MDB2-A-2]TFC11606.1 flagellar hook-associated protein FlgK [Cryobacterium sp. MDB2-33-2]TFC18857.1 flagellar hook-associated protein FlgK [Cryobacterium sp. MDB2-10]TFC21671.1 flagellar hook-associated protein FlgK [Cryobacterium glucosi]